MRTQPQSTIPMTVFSRSMYPISLALLTLVSTACAPKSEDKPVTTTDSAAAMPASGGKAPVDNAMAGAAGAPSGMLADQEFLRMMSDHHTGMVLMAHEVIERKEKLASKADARKFDQEQDDELDRMRSALKGMNDSYKPTATSEAKEMAASLSKLSGKEFDRTFWENTIKHHQMAIDMIDKYLPNLTHPDVKTMAERMRAAQMQEIDKMKKELGSA
jgi:uncharacterized protein (DUF305 family)